MTMINPGIEYNLDNDGKAVVRYFSPGRKVSDLRTEFNNDAKMIGDTFGPVYVLFSSGIDSQVIVRCMLDMKVDAQYVFLNQVGYNNVELAHIRECEIFYGIKVTIINLYLDEFRVEWIERAIIDRQKSNIIHLHDYSFEWLSSILPESWPIVTQGANEPAIYTPVGKEPAIYCNYYEPSLTRFRAMEPFRKILDFPLSSAAVASYYTDVTTKEYSATHGEIQKNIEQSRKIPLGQHWNYYGKAKAKKRYFGDEILWYDKLTGYESFPLWARPAKPSIKETRVTVPYWDLVNFLENSPEEFKDYSDWMYEDDDVGQFTSIVQYNTEPLPYSQGYINSLLKGYRM